MSPHSLLGPLSLSIGRWWLRRFADMLLLTSVCWCAVSLMAFDRHQTQYWLQVQSHNQEKPDRLSVSYQQQLYHGKCSEVLIYRSCTCLKDAATLQLLKKSKSEVTTECFYPTTDQVLIKKHLCIICDLLALEPNACTNKMCSYCKSNSSAFLH